MRSYECGTPQPQPHPNGSVDDHRLLVEDDSAEEKKEPNIQIRSTGSNTSTTNSNSTPWHNQQQQVQPNNNPSSNNSSDKESEMRGVHAINALPPNTVCMSIPRRCLITVEMGQATAIGQAILHSDLDLDAPKHIFLMIYLLWDRKVNGAASFFHPYYEILPQTLHNMPIFWTDAELAELQGSHLLHQIADRCQAIADDYHAILSVAPQLAILCTLTEFQWARMCVCSRNFGLQIDGNRTSALVPHADMLNHYRPRETKWTFDEERQAFTITTLQHINAGCEVLDSYGQKCNHRFLLNYGFAIEDNRELDGFCPNEVPIELTISTLDCCFAEKLEFWMRGEQQHQQSPPPQPHATNADGEMAAASAIKRVRVCVSNNENTRLLFSFLRTLACTPEEIRAVSKPGYHHHWTPTPPNASNSTLPSTTIARGSLFGIPSDATRRPPYASSPRINTTTSNTSASSPSPKLQAWPVVVLTASPAPAGATYHRSCRDVRHPLSLRNEQEAMRILLHTVQNLLSRYPATLQQDMEALQNEAAYPKFSNQRHARIQVRGEKQVLHHFATWATTALQILDVIEAELKEEEEDTSTDASAIEVRYRGAATNGCNSTTTNNNNNNIGYCNDETLVTIAEGNTIPSFDLVIRRIEEDYDDEGAVHHTIVRYCADVLGSLRREEFRNLRRRLSRYRNGKNNSHNTHPLGRAGNYGRRYGGGGSGSKSGG